MQEIEENILSFHQSRSSTSITGAGKEPGKGRFSDWDAEKERVKMGQMIWEELDAGSGAAELHV